MKGIVAMPEAKPMEKIDNDVKGNQPRWSIKANSCSFNKKNDPIPACPTVMIANEILKEEEHEDNDDESFSRRFFLHFNDERAFGASFRCKLVKSLKFKDF